MINYLDTYEGMILVKTDACPGKLKAPVSAYSNVAFVLTTAEHKNFFAAAMARNLTAEFPSHDLERMAIIDA